MKIRLIVIEILSDTVFLRYERHLYDQKILMIRVRQILAFPEALNDTFFQSINSIILNPNTFCTDLL